MQKTNVTVKDISRRIQDVRKRRGLTQDEVARQLGEPLGTYARWDGGQTELSSTNIVRVARALGCPVAFLYGELSMEEMEAHNALENYAALSPYQQRIVLAFIRSLLSVEP